VRSATLKFKNGAMGTIEATTSIWPGFTRRIEIHGCKGSVKLDSENVEVWQFADELPEDAPFRTKYGKKSELSGGAADRAPSVTSTTAGSSTIHPRRSMRG